MRFAGIDEAGYGPLLGPLSIAGVAVEAADGTSLVRAFRGARTGAKDSKQVHTPGDISAIEAVALPALTWLLGSRPATASACFAALGETPAVRQDIPWMADAETLALPIGNARLKTWRVPGVVPKGLHGQLVQPREYNAALRSGEINKADLELRAISGMLRRLCPMGESGQVVVDRLGGRRYYRSFLQEVWPDTVVMVQSEDALISTYQVIAASSEYRVSFCVEGEAQSVLTAIASCVAKYVREVHMVLLNRYFIARCPTLKPTAGYTRDAHRWLADLGAELTGPIADWLVRAGPAVPEVPANSIESVGA